MSWTDVMSSDARVSTRCWLLAAPERAFWANAAVAAFPDAAAVACSCSASMNVVMMRLQSVGE